MINAITVDVEDWYQSFENIDYASWHKYESRITASVDKCLKLLGDYGVKATFFILGYVAENNPEVVKMISAEGHELGTHGYNHQLVYNLTPDEFAADLRKSIRLIEELSAAKVLGYRAPAWSITEKSKWALDIIFREGLLYDSSISPFVSYLYGMRGCNKEPHVILKEGERALYEFPLSTVRFLKRDLPAGGGFFTRLYPYWFIRRSFRKINSEGRPVIFYFHPWDLDQGQPRLKLPLRMRRHYYNLKTTEKKIRRLLSDFKFAPVKDILLKGSAHD